MELNIFDTAAVLLVLAAVFAYINHRVFRLPFTIGMMLSGLAASLVVLLSDALFPDLGLGAAARDAVADIDFTESLMHGMLSFLLFAGAMHVNLNDLLARRGPILSLASVGVLISTAIVGGLSYGLFQAIDAGVPFAYCLVFGALISPTDPIAVLGIMKSVGAPKSLEVKIAGESLINDGFGVVVFTTLLAVAAGGSHGHGHGDSITAGFLVQMFSIEVLGGIALGIFGGWLCYWAMSTIDEPNLEVLFSFALVFGMTFFAFQVHTSAPLACVVAGLFIGNKGRRLAMSDRVREALDVVWAFIDEALNAVLFLLVGLELVVLRFTGDAIAAAVLMIPIALLARLISVAAPVALMSALRHEFNPGAIRVLTWGGLKGGISVALAMSLPAFPGRDTVLAATYAVVVFSIVVQGLTVAPMIRRLTSQESAS